jgi:hypothetical protein
LKLSQAVFFVSDEEAISPQTIPSRQQYLFIFQLIFFKFFGAVVDQAYDIYLIISLTIAKEHIFALLFFLTDFVPGLFTVWQSYLRENKTLKKKHLLLCCHPLNMILWPIIVAFDPNTKKKNQLEVGPNF